jgi:1-pyrroline-5-carboxylate dehydrogenase
MNGFFRTPPAYNEPIFDYAPGSPARQALKSALEELMNEPLEVPMIIGGQEVTTGDLHRLAPPHQHAHTLGHYHRGRRQHVEQAVAAALAAKPAWEAMPWEERAAIFLRAADLISGPYRATLNASTILAQSKTAFQSEIDAICELADFLRFNVQYMTEIYAEQPDSARGIWNRMEYRPLEGFVFALTPFNFTAIAGNLPSAPALMGNTVVWKPADSQIYSAHFVMEIFREAGLPDGVINLVFCDGPTVGDVVFNHREFAGIHFTGSTGVFRHIWKTIGQNIDKYRSYPRIVGETGGKDFILIHPTADVAAAATAITRGAFEFQGQKCSAASRVYIPESMFEGLVDLVKDDLADITPGSPLDFRNFFTAVIDKRSYDKIVSYIEWARQDPDSEILHGGQYDDSVGYFIHPTVIHAKKPNTRTMCEEIFGPVVTFYTYQDEEWEQVLKLVDENEYALTGSIFAQDRAAVLQATNALRNAAGNFYINDKPTGAVVNQQPFGGARGSGTNDKAGSKLNLLRWVSARTIKETLVPPTDYRYPFMGAE